MIFEDRKDAGQKLAKKLEGFVSPSGVVLAIPRGGVVVGKEVAQEFKLPLDLIIPRKIGAPFNPELAIGAVAQDGTAIFDHFLLRRFGLKEESLKAQVAEEIEEIKRRMKLYRGRCRYPEWIGRQVILVDDGIATGYTTMAALCSIKKMFQPRELILAVPVAPPETIAFLQKEVKRVVCLAMPETFLAVGNFYHDFSQTTDQEVIEIFKKYSRNDLV